MKKLVSIIIPCYNQGKFLDEAVDSILSQIYENIEIIIVNDGSTDTYTNILLKNYRKPKTRIVHTQNFGLAQARNNGLKYSNGDFIQFLDSDDLISGEKIDMQVKFLNNNPEFDICYCNTIRFQNNLENTNSYFYQVPKPEKLFVDLFHFNHLSPVPVHSLLLRGSVIKKNGLFNSTLRACEDREYWIRAKKNNIRFGYLDINGAFYRMHSGSMNQDQNHMIIGKKEYLKVVEHYINEEKKRFTEDDAHYLADMYFYLLLKGQEFKLFTEEQKKSFVFKIIDYDNRYVPSNRSIIDRVIHKSLGLKIYLHYKYLNGFSF